jgi:hypothetical protein
LLLLPGHRSPVWGGTMRIIICPGCKSEFERPEGLKLSGYTVIPCVKCGLKSCWSVWIGSHRLHGTRTGVPTARKAAPAPKPVRETPARRPGEHPAMTSLEKQAADVADRAFSLSHTLMAAQRGGDEQRIAELEAKFEELLAESGRLYRLWLAEMRSKCATY